MNKRFVAVEAVGLFITTCLKRCL